MEEMIFDYSRIKIYPAPFMMIGNEQYTKYKVFYEMVYHDHIGRSYAQIKKVCTYDSIEDMEADFAGFIAFMEYQDEIDMEAEYEDEKGNL